MRSRIDVWHHSEFRRRQSFPFDRRTRRCRSHCDDVARRRTFESRCVARLFVPIPPRLCRDHLKDEAAPKSLVAKKPQYTEVVFDRTLQKRRPRRRRHLRYQYLLLKDHQQGM